MSCRIMGLKPLSLTPQISSFWKSPFDQTPKCVYNDFTAVELEGGVEEEGREVGREEGVGREGGVDEG